MTNKKLNRLDESFTGDSLQKAFTGNTSTAIDPNKIVITSTGVVQSSTGNTQATSNTNSETTKK